MKTIVVNKFDGTFIQLTTKQVRAIKRVYRRSNTDIHDTWPSFRDFVSLAQPTIGCDGMVAFPWYGMWLAIEQSGYTHS